MKTIKVYQTILYGYLSKSFVIDGKEVSVIFEGGDNNKGVYQTDIKAIQEYLENSPAFKQDYNLKAILKNEEPSPADTGSVADTPLKTVDVSTNDDGIEEISGISNFQVAKKYLIDNKEITPDQVPNKATLIQVCETLKVKFIDMK